MERLGPITATDEILVKRYMILPLVLSAFERDKTNFFESGYFKAPKLYTYLIDKAMDAATQELYGVRKAFRDRGIKVYDEHRVVKGVQAKYMCRGYQSEMFMRWPFITAEASVLMRQFLGLVVSEYINPSIPENMREETSVLDRIDT